LSWWKRQILTYQNRAEYRDLVLKAYYDYYVPQANAIREGLSLIVPMNILETFLDWKLFEIKVCGVLEIPVQPWKDVSEYAMDPLDPRCNHFWNFILRLFNGYEREVFLKFVLGRCRFPDKGLTVNQGFEIHFESLSTTDSPPEINQRKNIIKLPNYTSADTLFQNFFEAMRLDLDKNEEIDYSSLFN